MRVTMVGCTQFDWAAAMNLTREVWQSESDMGQDLIEFAGRACYQSWGRPNPATSDNLSYIGNILEMQHFSVLEHGSVSFYIDGVSRALTHELIRHRHLSVSQESQRFVKVKRNDEDDTANFVTPPLFADEPNSVAYEILWGAWNKAYDAYEELLAIAEDMPEVKRKQAREAARCVLPNMTPTSGVWTGNHRSWREFLTKRGGVGADVEIRELALEILGQLKDIDPNVYQDMSIGRADDKDIILFGDKNP